MKAIFLRRPQPLAKCVAMDVDQIEDGTRVALRALDDRLAAHVAADDKEARDVAFIREFLREHPRDAHLRAQPLGHLTGSGFVLDSTRTRVLLLFHGKLRRWLQPGGHGEGELDPRLIALREIEEETGIGKAELAPFPDERLLDVDVHLIPARPNEPEHPHLDLRYGFIAREGVLPQLSEESTDLRWFDLDALPGGVDDSLRRAVSKLGGAKNK
jgi:8-oxo-dGTP pyrophosphatase MutT (NUDIX family)